MTRYCSMCVSCVPSISMISEFVTATMSALYTTNVSAVAETPLFVKILLAVTLRFFCLFPSFDR